MKAGLLSLVVVGLLGSGRREHVHGTNACSQQRLSRRNHG